MRLLGGFIVILGGVAIGFKGLWTLFKYKKYLMIFGHLLFLIDAPFAYIICDEFIISKLEGNYTFFGQLFLLR